MLMKNKSYISNYIKIYFWEFTSIIFRFISMFIVIPFLTKDPGVYGIYSICISLGIFLNYADLGFLKATKKYAAEYFAKGDIINEMKFLGFGVFVLLLFTIILSGSFFYLAVNPNLLIDDLNDSNIYISQQLIVILAVFTLLIPMKKLIDMIFKIRLESFIPKKFFLLGSIITIISTFYFFSNDNYMIVQYFLFFKIIDLLVVLICFFIAKKKYNYKFIKLFSFIRFSTEVYGKANRLAYSGLYLMFAWVLFYELDQIIIGKHFGSEKVAIYAVALFFPVLFRQIFGIFFTPFVERANHLIGINDNDGLQKLIFKIVVISAPLTVIPTLAVAIVAKPIILSWVGINYIESINLSILLALSYSFSFITYPTDIILLSKEKIKELYIVATIPVFVFWLGIIFTNSYLGLFSFSLFKFLGMLIIQIIYLPILLKTLNISFNIFLTKVIIPLIIPLVFLIPSLFYLNNFLPTNKSKVNFIIILLTTSFFIFLSFLLFYFMSKEFKLISKNIFYKLIKNN